MQLTIILYAAAAVLLAVSLIKSREKTKMALKKAWKAFESILPQFLSVLIIIGVVLSFLSAETIFHLIGKDSGFLGVVVLGVIGAISLIPGFVALPLAASLLHSGAGYMQMAAFISTLMMVGVVTMPLEFKYFGKKMTLIRNGLAFGFCFLIAAVIGVILQ